MARDIHGWQMGVGRTPDIEWVAARDAAQHPTVPRTALMSAVLRSSSRNGGSVLGGRKVRPHHGLNRYILL